VLLELKRVSRTIDYENIMSASAVDRILSESVEDIADNLPAGHSWTASA